jgi:hypothetical protein
MCKASDRECALSLFGEAVSTSYVPLSFLRARLMAIAKSASGVPDYQYLRVPFRFLFLHVRLMVGQLRGRDLFYVSAMCKASDRECALSLFGKAVSASYVPFQSDHKVMAHSAPTLRTRPTPRAHFAMPTPSRFLFSRAHTDFANVTPHTPLRLAGKAEPGTEQNKIE